MNKPLKLCAIGAGGLLGFGGAFVGFSRMLGADWHEIAVVGSLFPAPSADGHAEEAREPEVIVKQAPAQRPASIGVLDIFQVESPFSSTELEELAQTLEHKLDELDLRLEEVAEREQRAEDRSAFLDEQYATLSQLRTGLETWENELRQREVEVERDEAARAALEAESWARLAKLFEKGDAGEQSQRLLSYSPDEAASILLRLKPARAQELLDELEGEAWKAYAEAYRMREPE
jgi:flagellar motility protein MotE (MotC chaperone)